jgi:polar amino acid transport system ATP-binding protein
MNDKKLEGDSKPDPLEFVCVDGLTKRFGDNLVLDSLSLRFGPNERIVVIGPSGSGKTTLLRCLMGLEEIDSGKITFCDEIYIENKNGKTFVDKKIQRRVGMVFQHYTLFPHMTVLANLTLAPIRVRRQSEEAAIQRAANLLKRLGLSDKAKSYPGTLSGGQKQRVAIARALMLEPKLMLFDEITSALDPELVGEVLEVMLQLAQRDMGMVIITHEMAFAQQIASRVIFIDRGVVVEEGHPRQLLSSPTEARTRKFLSHFFDSALYNERSQAEAEPL